MTAAPLADVDALANWLGTPIPAGSPESTRADAMLSAASLAVRSYAGREWADPVQAPEAAGQVVIQAAARAYAQPRTTYQNTAGYPPQQQYGDPGAAVPQVYLTTAEKNAIDFAIGRQHAGLSTISTYRGDIGRDETDYIQVIDGSKFPFLDSDGRI